MRQAQNTDTHTLNQLGVSQKNFHSDPISLLISTFDIHLEPECESYVQIIHYRTAKNAQTQARVFVYF